MEFTAARARRALAGFVVLCGSLGWPHAQPQMTHGVLPSISVPAQAHEADAAAAGPFVSLSLDEGTGTIAGDASGNGNTGTLLNGPTWVAGKTGGALRFDGADDTLYIANSSTLNSATTGMTVAAWVYRETNQSGGVSVVSRQLGTTFYEHFYLGFESGKYRWFVNTTSGYSDTTVGRRGTARSMDSPGRDLRWNRRQAVRERQSAVFHAPLRIPLGRHHRYHDRRRSQRRRTYAGRSVQRSGRRRHDLRTGADGGRRPSGLQGLGWNRRHPAFGLNHRSGRGCVGAGNVHGDRRRRG